VDASLPGCVAQEFEVQLGDRHLGGVAMAARKWASRVWEEEKRVGLASPPTTDAFIALGHTRERKIEEEERKGEKAEEVA
jgi:hypothetical protein